MLSMLSSLVTPSWPHVQILVNRIFQATAVCVRFKVFYLIAYSSEMWRWNLNYLLRINRVNLTALATRAMWVLGPISPLRETVVKFSPINNCIYLLFTFSDTRAPAAAVKIRANNGFLSTWIVQILLQHQTLKYERWIIKLTNIDTKALPI